MGLIKRIFRKKENRFEHIISLGYNCEVTFRFLKYFKYEEANLFNWAYSYTILDLINALNNFDKIGTGNFDFPNPLFECKNTHIRFHGKIDMAMYINHKVNIDIIEQDKLDLISRIMHLKEKFLLLARDNSYKLYIYKIRDCEFNYENIKLLKTALNNIGAQNYKLLIIVQKNALLQNNEMCFNSNDYNYEFDSCIIRFVSQFADDNCVTNKKYFNNGWNDIFDEFYCKKSTLYVARKKYKFER